MNRIPLAWIVCAVACVGPRLEAAPAPGETVIKPPTYHLAFSLTETQKARLARALEPLHAKYDAAERMLKSPFSSPGYHTTLTGGMVHSTRSSLHYAIALLDTGEEAHLRRATDILRRVMSLQDTNPASKTYGIWSWFLEEPLEKMSPPDWNWADFCGTALLQAALYHRERLPPDLQPLLDAAIQHAARSIQRRNVGPDYTNIAIMGSYVTLVAAELYQMDDVKQYALARWRRFHRHTLTNRAFTEYNSPTYTVVALEELGRMNQHVRDPESRRLLAEVYRVAWEEIAQHFHAPTRQWAGPHSRCYSTLLKPETLAILQRGTEGRMDFGVDSPGIDEHRLPLPCPRDLEPCFTTARLPRTLVKTFVSAAPPVIGTTHLESAFALGSINRGDLWNQRRALLAYWGTADKPAYLHLRMLHDGYDFAAAQFFSVQQTNRVLAGINFAVNGGDRHVSLDRLKNGEFRAKDLRLRFEFGGTAADLRLVAPKALSTPARLTHGDVTLDLAVPFASFPPATPKWEAGRGGAKAWLDVVLYSGEERAISLAAVTSAAAAVAVRVTTRESTPPSVEAGLQEGKLRLEWDGLRLAIPAKPATVSELQRSFQSY